MILSPTRITCSGDGFKNMNQHYPHPHLQIFHHGDLIVHVFIFPPTISIKQMLPFYLSFSCFPPSVSLILKDPSSKLLSVKLPTQNLLYFNVLKRSDISHKTCKFVLLFCWKQHYQANHLSSTTRSRCSSKLWCD